MTTTTAASTTTYVARTATTVPATDRNTRATKSMLYTHAVVGRTSGDAYTWHTSEALARKEATKRTGSVVVAVEAYDGGKATVLRRLAAEAPAPTLAAVVQATSTSATWDATTTDTHTCAGACGQELPATSFPTTRKPGQRGTTCRKDRDAARTPVAA